MQINRTATETTIRDLKNTVSDLSDPFGIARMYARSLGAHVLDADTALFGFWTPELEEEDIPESAITLELFTIADPDFLPTGETQRLPVDTETTETIRDGQYTWAVVSGVNPGTKDTLGTLYRLRFTDRAGQVRYVYDPLAHSVPFGAAAPAELYDIEKMFRNRRDEEHFRTQGTVPEPDGIPRVAAPVTLLEIHIPTATGRGTFAGLSTEFRRIGEQISQGKKLDELNPADQAILGYEAVQVMPIEPTILFEDGESFWEEHLDGTVTVRRPNTTNWGYDVITLGAPAPNPTLLETGRPDELLEFIETLHTFPGRPIQVVFDIVYGHADNQALPLLNGHFFAGANMYGQNLNYRHPVVRALLLEMQRRKSNYGADGIRVDGAQDFKYWVQEDNRLYHDDEYLGLMNDIVQDVAGRQYRPWMIFEDGRPWPRDDWELSSTYHEVTKRLPRVVQWGPLTFAHNTPFLFTFWISKWWRIRELLETGAHWITGNSNHDTLRRGTQVHPDAPVNTYLGSTKPEIFENGYDNAGARLFDAFVPGIPMDFLNANLRGPWSFVRNTDSRWAIKVVSEETWFLDWNVTPERFVQPWAFPRLKALGFRSLDGLKQFIRGLDGAVRTGEYDPEAIAGQLNSIRPRLQGPPDRSGDDIKKIARAWMDDVHEFCNLDHYRHRVNTDALISSRRYFARSVREFRRRERWLAGNLTEHDRFDYLHPTEGSVIMAGHRYRPDHPVVSDGVLPVNEVAPNSEWRELLFVANMEGAPRRIVIADVMNAIGASVSDGWETVLITPGLNAGNGIYRDKPSGRGLPRGGSIAVTVDEEMTLENSQGCILGLRG